MDLTVKPQVSHSVEEVEETSHFCRTVQLKIIISSYTIGNLTDQTEHAHTWMWVAEQWGNSTWLSCKSRTFSLDRLPRQQILWILKYNFDSSAQEPSWIVQIYGVLWTRTQRKANQPISKLGGHIQSHTVYSDCPYVFRSHSTKEWKTHFVKYIKTEICGLCYSWPFSR